MPRTRSPIAGSLNGLLVLEAAARLGSFSLAAQELNLSQPAISRHISALEARLGRELFLREHNKVKPTEIGRKLGDAVSLGFGHVAAIWRDVSEPADRDDVVLVCSYGFADQWLMPRFSRLREAMEGARLHVTTSDQMNDIDFRHIDAAVVWDLGRMPDRPAIALVRDETFPVCSPGFLSRIQMEQREGGISGSPEPRLCSLPSEYFLHFDVRGSDFLTWKDWFVRAGLPVPDFGHPLEYDAYPFLIRAALHGEGIALGWRGLVDQLLTDGSLVRAGPSVSKRDTSYYLQHRPISEENGPLARLVAWFTAEADRR